MALVETVELAQKYGECYVLQSINLKIEKGEVFALIGPTGAGKTTLLRLLDQLDSPLSGRIYLDGQDVLKSGQLEMRRKLAMVLQKPVVFNASVYENIAFPLKVRGYSRDGIFVKVKGMLELIGLEGMLRRNARALSGGEAQRVALARAMITGPEVLLLDEPTANLDPVSVNLIEELILRFNRERGTTIVMATHDMSQGQRLADRIGVLMEGELIEVGRGGEIFNAPGSIKVARFVGIENILEGVVSSNEGGIVSIEVHDHIIEGISDCQAGEAVHVCIRPEDVTLSFLKSSSSARNLFSAEITQLASSGPLTRVALDCGFPLVALVTKRSAAELELQAGKKVYASFKATAIHIISGE